MIWSFLLIKTTRNPTNLLKTFIIFEKSSCFSYEFCGRLDPFPESEWKSLRTTSRSEKKADNERYQWTLVPSFFNLQKIRCCYLFKNEKVEPICLSFSHNHFPLFAQSGLRSLRMCEWRNVFDSFLFSWNRAFSTDIFTISWNC